MQFGPYILDEQVGRGAMAEVWSGWHAGRSEHVAIKIVTRLAGGEETELDAFLHEVRTVASLSHPGIVQILDYGHGLYGPDELPVPYLVTELARGGTLAAGWRAGTFIDVRRAVQAILDALAHAHARGVIHRDLKPGNVLRMTADPDSPLKVTDFGLARSAPLGERSWADDMIAGTPRYMAPEQVRGEWRDHGPWTDLYAVGGIAWAMVTGRPPYEGERADVYRKQLEEPLPPLRPRIAVPDGFEDWLRWLLTKDISERCDRAADAAMELLALQLPDDPATVEVSYLPDDLLTLSSDELPGLSWSTPAPDRVERLRQQASTNRALTSVTMHNELRLWGLRRPPFVGRRAQRTALWSALQDAFESAHPQLVTIEGPPGAGKTALTHWVAERSHELGLAEPMFVLHDPASRRHEGLRGAFMRAYRLEGLGAAEAVSRLRAWLTRYLDDATALEYAGVLGDWIAAEDDHTSSSFETQERARAALALLRGYARTRVPLVCIEDADRAAPTLALLNQIVELAADESLRLMIVATRRRAPSSRADAELRRLGEFCVPRSVVLTELSDVDLRDLLDAMLPLDPSFRAAVISQSRGNPLVATQMLSTLIARDELVMNERGLFSVRESAVPTSSFMALLDMRINSLGEQLGANPDDIRIQLEIAATLGGAVRAVEWLVASQKEGVPVRRDLLDAMIRGGIATPTAERWTFAHDLVRDELIESARREGRWQHWNEVCAAVLDDLYPRPDAERRASHLLEAQTWSLAADACIAAAEDTLRSNAPERALRWLDRATVAFEKGDLPADDMRRSAVKVLRERVTR